MDKRQHYGPECWSSLRFSQGSRSALSKKRVVLSLFCICILFSLVFDIALRRNSLCRLQHSQHPPLAPEAFSTSGPPASHQGQDFGTLVESARPLRDALAASNDLTAPPSPSPSTSPSPPAHPIQPHLRPVHVEVLDSSPDQCATAFRVPKVALLFLTKGKLPHAHTWELWLRSAAGVLPAEYLIGALCSDSAPSDVAMAACSTDFKGDAAWETQHLFNVYVHVPPDVPESELGEGWRGRLVQHRVHTAWGTHSLVEAERSLVWEAFRDPSNQRFVLISEADVPIWDPMVR